MKSIYVAPMLAVYEQEEVDVLTGSPSSWVSGDQKQEDFFE